MKYEKGTEEPRKARPADSSVLGDAIVIPILQKRKTEAQGGNMIKATLPHDTGARTQAQAVCLVPRAHVLNHPAIVREYHTLASDMTSRYKSHLLHHF